MKRYFDLDRNCGSHRSQRNTWRIRRQEHLVLRLTVTEQSCVFRTQTRPFRRFEYYLPCGFYVVASLLLRAMTRRLLVQLDQTLQGQLVFLCPLLLSILRWLIHPPTMVSRGYFVNRCCQDFIIRFSSTVTNSKMSESYLFIYSKSYTYGVLTVW